jgi:hypothetical protein
MALSNATSEPNERTALLNENTPQPNDPPLSNTIKPAGNGNTEGEVSKSGVDNGGNVDEEAVEVTEDNPLFEGNKEMRKKLYILCPAVAIGVSFQLIHSGCAKQVGLDIN